jgi:hypothetical protein
MNSLEEIGALLGFVAFAGLAVLVFLTFQQARHVRRLRDWAGRAPERAAAMAAREQEGGEEGAEDAEHDDDFVDPPEERTRAFDGLRTRASAAWAELDRRSPADPKLLLGGLAAIILGVGIATSGFGLLGEDTSADRGSRTGKSNGGDNSSGGGEKEKKVEVAVLNGTAPPGGTGVAGVADSLSTDVKDAGFKVGAVDNAGSFTTSVVMYTGNDSSEADELAESLVGALSSVTVEAMTPEVEALSGGADLAVVIGQSDAGI